MSQDLPIEEKKVHVRYTLRETAHTKILTFQRRLSAHLDKDVTQEEALNELLKAIDLPGDIEDIEKIGSEQ